MRCQNSKFHWEVLKIVLIYLQDSSVTSEEDKNLRYINFSTGSQCLPHGHLWENLQMTARDLCSIWIFATQSKPTTPQTDLQPFPKTSCQAGHQGELRFTAQKALLAGRQKLPRESVLSSIKHPLSSYVSTVTKSEGQFLAFTSQFVVITIPRG